MITIRRGEERDIPQIEELLYQVHKVHADGRPDLFVPGAKKYTREELSAILSDDTRPVYVAEAEGAVLGYAFCVYQQPESGNMYPQKTLYIDDLCVSRESRGQHVGTRLYEHVVAQARVAGCHSVTLNVWACNQSAVDFYRHLGMKIQKYGMETLLE